MLAWKIKQDQSIEGFFDLSHNIKQMAVSKRKQLIIILSNERRKASAKKKQVKRIWRRTKEKFDHLLSIVRAKITKKNISTLHWLRIIQYQNSDLYIMLCIFLELGQVRHGILHYWRHLAIRRWVWLVPNTPAVSLFSHEGIPRNAIIALLLYYTPIWLEMCLFYCWMFIQHYVPNK